MKYMYFISIKKPNKYPTYSSWYGGNTEDEAKANCLAINAKFYNLNKNDIKIVECKLQGDFITVLNELQRG